MRHLTLKSAHCDHLGLLGLKLAGIYNHDSESVIATEGRLIAHDIMEHQNGPQAIGTISDECIALGGSWFVRGQFGGFNKGTSYHSAETGLASDFAELARLWILCGQSFGPDIPAQRPIKDPCVESALDEIMRGALDTFASEVRHDKPESPVMADWKRFRLMASAGFRLGWRKANKRYRGCAGEAYDQFWAIADAVDPITRALDFDGQKFRLSYGNGYATVSEIYSEDY